MWKRNEKYKSWPAVTSQPSQPSQHGQQYSKQDLRFIDTKD